MKCVCCYITRRVFGVSQWYQWYTNIVQGFTNGTIGNTISTNGNANGTIGSPSGTTVVKLPMVPLGEPRTEPRLAANRYKKQERCTLIGEILG